MLPLLVLLFWWRGIEADDVEGEAEDELELDSECLSGLLVDAAEGKGRVCFMGSRSPRPLLLLGWMGVTVLREWRFRLVEGSAGFAGELEDVELEVGAVGTAKVADRAAAERGTAMGLRDDATAVGKVAAPVADEDAAPDARLAAINADAVAAVGRAGASISLACNS